MQHMQHGSNFGYGSIWSMIVFWLALITLLVLLIRSYSQNNAPRQKQTPFEIIKERLAKGEIDEQEYQRLKRVLKDDESS